MRVPTGRFLGAGALACLLAACTSSGGYGGTDSAPPGTSLPGTSLPAPTSGTSGAAGCPATGSGVPAGARSRPTVDVDGDRRPDTVWLVPGPHDRFGITTASGATFETATSLAGPSTHVAMVADVTGDGSQIIGLATDHRTVELTRVIDCAFAVVVDPKGAPYTFSLGFTDYGTGVGCLDATGDGVRDLVGLNVARYGGAGISITATAVRLDGPVATNGAMSEVPLTPAAEQAASTVTCGDATLENAGVTASA